jgi:hypothetical protein
MLGKVVRNRPCRFDGGDCVLEDQLVVPADFDDDSEFVEILDASLEVSSVHQENLDGQTVATGEVEKNVLDVGLSGR